MPIIDTDIKLHLSGGSSNTDVNLSLGGVRSTTEVVTATTHNLFDKVSSTEATSGTTEYRCVYARNTHGSLTLDTARVFIATQTPSADTTVEIAVGSAAINGTEQTVGTETTAPTGVTFSAPSTYATGLALGNLATNEHKAIWIKRIVSPGAAAFNDSFILRVQGDTAP